VMAPGGLYLRDNLTLSRALAMVGGVRKEAKLSDVMVYRVIPGSTEQKQFHVDVAAIRKNQKPDFLLEPYDTIEVSESGLFSGARIGQTLFSAFTGGVQNAVSASGSYLPMRIIY